MSQEIDRRRVFFALWPDDALRDRLARLSRELRANGRLVPVAHLHLTLAFAGVVPAPVVTRIATDANRLARPAIRLTLDRLGHFRRPRIAWVGPSDAPAELDALAQSLSGICRDAGVAMDDRPFRPHVTLRRFVTRMASGPIEPIAWVAPEMVLIESGRGGHPGPYRVLQRWRLA
ncbi:2'-5' RNA ligase [Thioalkalivibrio nitratireducens DSM 14787]|uniref:RNA 2',3'-cyclic phosphodiesterase n=1 Tax=Thioalkalivibrio nitratireducens (strain DSM 14787 / UNIQEM 213 / ALEN2) TaxID=1255043 RepID=L0DZV5_THIND|nr:RNA 2',3'-cyclic phosphodiesterase [Thioalkalivibrio nitratireducens]AGA33891.1 2'-5' RNA ligase [Thioalkalivibrio nitratireducens DSM 14787]